MTRKLLFPNKNKPKETPVTEDDMEKQQTREIKKIRERVELLEREAQLEKEREQRIRKKSRKMNEAQIRKQLKKRQAIAMRMRNIPVDVIAERLGVTPGYANDLIREAIAELPEETAEDLKKLLGRTVVQLIGNFEKTALSGGVREAEVMLKGITQLMKLSGLNIQHKAIEQTNMNLGEVSPGIDVADLDLDLETKKKILEAIRNNKKLQEQLKNDKLQEKENEAGYGDEDGNSSDTESGEV